MEAARLSTSLCSLDTFCSLEDDAPILADNQAFFFSLRISEFCHFPFDSLENPVKLSLPLSVYDLTDKKIKKIRSSPTQFTLVNK